MIKKFAVLLNIFTLAVLAAATVYAQSTKAGPDRPAPIQDNSFLIEEAYNQEVGVVQHINTFMRLSASHDWAYTFTEEFPVGSIKNQLSYTLSVIHSGDEPGMQAGLGDLALNYRYQAIGSGNSRVAFSPRLTLLVPTGNYRYGRGSGGIGFQTNLPLSAQLNDRFVTHWNAGATVVPSARNEAGASARTSGFNLGQSTVWLAHPRFNVLFETLWTGTERVVGTARTVLSHDLLLNPGVRWAHNLKNGLQIVPGVAFPIGVGPSSGEKGIFLYLSFEHPWAAFRKD